MHPIKYDFSKIDSKLQDKFIRMHNNIYEKMSALKTQIESSTSLDPSIEKYVLIFFEFFEKLVSTSTIKETIFCIDENKQSKILEKIEGISLNTSKIKQDSSSIYVISTETDAKTILKIIQEIFGYDNKRQHFYKLLNKLDIHICSYCLTQYAIIYEAKVGGKKEWKMTAQLDHLLPKSENPYFSLSINNLFPVCGHCNNRKGTKKINYNPLSNKKEYTWNFDRCLEIKSGKVQLNNLKNFEIKSVNSIAKGEDLVEVLNYKSLYSHFEEYAKVYVDRFNKFGTIGYGKHFSAVLGEIDEFRLKEFLTDQPLKEENIFKYPLTKFKLEIYNTVKNKSKKD